MDKKITSGIAGAVIASTIFLGGYNPEDIDPITGYSYVDLIENPEIDVYYLPETENIDNSWWEFVHEKPETVRTCNGRTLIKGDISEISRDVNTEFLGQPYTQPEVIEFLQANCPERDQ